MDFNNIFALNEAEEAATAPQIADPSKGNQQALDIANASLKRTIQQFENDTKIKEIAKAIDGEEETKKKGTFGHYRNSFLKASTNMFKIVVITTAIAIIVTIGVSAGMGVYKKKMAELAAKKAKEVAGGNNGGDALSGGVSKDGLATNKNAHVVGDGNSDSANGNADATNTKAKPEEQKQAEADLSTWQGRVKAGKASDADMMEAYKASQAGTYVPGPKTKAYFAANPTLFPAYAKATTTPVAPTSTVTPTEPAGAASDTNGNATPTETATPTTSEEITPAEEQKNEEIVEQNPSLEAQLKKHQALVAQWNTTKAKYDQELKEFQNANKKLKMFGGSYTIIQNYLRNIGYGRTVVNEDTLEQVNAQMANSPRALGKPNLEPTWTKAKAEYDKLVALKKERNEALNSFNTAKQSLTDIKNNAEVLQGILKQYDVALTKDLTQEYAAMGIQ